MENGTERYIETVKYLEKLYDYINGRLFGGELEKPVITVQRDERNKAFGWYSTEKVWKERGENEGVHELNITAQYLNRSVSEIAETLIHEMCHNYARQNHIQDCSRGGTYHNKLFLRIAEMHGLKVQCLPKIGYSHTELTEGTAALIAEFVKDNPESIIYRSPVFKGQTVRTSSTRKYKCPICGQSVRATKEVRILCLDCNEPMTEE